MNIITVNQTTKEKLPLEKPFFKDLKIRINNYLPDNKFIISDTKSVFPDLYIYQLNGDEVYYVKTIKSEYNIKNTEPEDDFWISTYND